jgi:predicted PurR-regulated permease PerM
MEKGLSKTKGDDNAQMNWRRSVDVTWKELVIALTIFTLIILSFLFVWYLLDFFLLAFAGLLLAILLRIPTNWLRDRTPLSGRWSLFVVFLVFGLITALGIWLMSPSISQQYDEFVEVLPEGLNQLEEAIRGTPWGDQLLDQAIQWNDLSSSLGNLFTGVSGVFSSVVGVVTNVIILIFIGFYLSFQPGLYLEGLIRLFPEERRAKVRDVSDTLAVSLKWWLIGRLLSMLVLGVMVGIGLWILGVPLALFLGILTGLLSFVPTIGGVLAFIPAGLVGLTQGPSTLLYVLILYLGAQLIETYIITPAIVQQSVMLPAALGIMAQLLFGILAGPLGIALGYPIAVIGIVLVKKLYIEGFLGERASLPGS